MGHNAHKLTELTSFFDQQTTVGSPEPGVFSDPGGWCVPLPRMFRESGFAALDPIY